MPAGLSPLDDQGVGSSWLGGGCLIRARDRDPYLGAGEMHLLDELAGRATKLERDHLHRIRSQHPDLGFPVVIVVARFPNRHAGVPSPVAKPRDI